MQRLEFSGAVRPIYVSLGVKRLNCGLFSISIPQDLGKYLVHQAEPLYLSKINKTGRWPGIPEGAVKTDSPTAIHPLGTALTP